MDPDLAQETVGPDVVGIQLDGAATLESGPIMGGIMHLLGEVDPQEVHIGMRVQAVWKAPEDRAGAITDILYFKPIGD